MPLDEKDFASFSFKSRVENVPFGEQQLFLDCYGPVEVVSSAPSAPANSTQEKFLFSLPPEESKSLVVKVSGKPFQASDVDKVELVARKPGLEIRSRLPQDGSA